MTILSLFFTLSNSFRSFFFLSLSLPLPLFLPPKQKNQNKKKSFHPLTAEPAGVVPVAATPASAAKATRGGQ